MLEYWNNGMAPFGQSLASVLHSSIPSFHYSGLEEKEWLGGNPLLSSIFRNSDTFTLLKLRLKKIHLAPSSLVFCIDNLRYLL
jgi:hypothetical protein